MKCSLCGHEFDEKEGKAACRGCPMGGACHMIRCPNCGYDMLAESPIIKTLKSWRKPKNGAKGTGRGTS